MPPNLTLSSPESPQFYTLNPSAAPAAVSALALGLRRFGRLSYHVQVTAIGLATLCLPSDHTSRPNPAVPDGCDLAAVKLTV